VGAALFMVMLVWLRPGLVVQTPTRCATQTYVNTRRLGPYLLRHSGYEIRFHPSTCITFTETLTFSICVSLEIFLPEMTTANSSIRRYHQPFTSNGHYPFRANGRILRKQVTSTTSTLWHTAVTHSRTILHSLVSLDLL